MTAIKVIVFDFDGTLVESNQLKYEAYFELFPKDNYHDRAIRQILSTSFEESRDVILEKILRQIDPNTADLMATVNRLAEQYNRIVVEAVKNCPECPGAETTLRQLSARLPLYLSSTTPEEALRAILSFRNWRGYFRDVFGYPRKKIETLRELLQREQVTPDQILVVGDGDSDRIAAAAVGCQFFCVNDHPLSAVALWNNRR